jgi:hypothetical protein
MASSCVSHSRNTQCLLVHANNTQQLQHQHWKVRWVVPHAPLHSAPAASRPANHATLQTEENQTMVFAAAHAHAAAFSQLLL